MMAVHEGDADPLRRGLEHQWPRIEEIDSGGLEIGHTDRLPPLGEGFRHFAVKQDGQPLQLFGNRDRALAVGQVARRDSSEVRRVGKECVRTCSSRWSPYLSKKNTSNKSRGI